MLELQRKNQGLACSNLRVTKQIKRLVHSQTKGKLYQSIILIKINNTGALPEIAGVSTPSPTTMQAPNSTTRSRAVLNLLCFSRNLFNGEEAAACEEGPYL